VFWTTAKVEPRGPDAFDAGRTYEAGGGLSFRATGLGGATKLIVRTDGPGELAVLLDGADAGSVALSEATTWSEGSLDLGEVEFPLEIQLRAVETTRLAHVWLIAHDR
jgi:hypothetical protein